MAVELLIQIGYVSEAEDLSAAVKHRYRVSHDLSKPWEERCEEATTGTSLAGLLFYPEESPSETRSPPSRAMSAQHIHRSLHRGASCKIHSSIEIAWDASSETEEMLLTY